MSVGGQGVIDARRVVAGALGRAVAEEHAAGIGDFLRQGDIAGGLDNQVFGRIAIGEGYRFRHISQHDNPAVGERLRDYFFSRQLRQLCGQGLHDLVHKGFRGGNQQRLTVDAVLRLCKQVGGDEGRIGGFVGDNGHFRRAGRQVDGHALQARELLGGGYVAVAGAEQLVHFRDAFRAAGHGGDGLYAAGFEDAVNACRGGGIEDGRVYFPFAVGRRAEHNLTASRKACGNGQHQHGGKQRRRPARDVQPHFLDGYRLLPAGNAGRGFNLFHLATLRGVECLDVRHSRANGLFQLAGHQCLGLAYFLFRHAECGEGYAVKFRCVTFHRVVAAAAHVVEHAPHRVEQRRHIIERPPDKRVPLD